MATLLQVETLTDLQGNGVTLVFKPTTQDTYRLRYGQRLTMPQPVIDWHTPEGGEREGVRVREEDRTLFYNLQIGGDKGPFGTNDINERWLLVKEAIAKVRRMIGTASSQAIQYELERDTNPIYVLKILGGTTASGNLFTLHRVKSGFVDDQTAYDELSMTNQIADKVVIGLTLEPYGIQAVPIVLRNLLPGDASFSRDLDDDGLANGWVEHLGLSTHTLSDFEQLTNGYGQAITTPAGGTRGIRSVTTPITPTTELYAYVWVRPSSNSAGKSVTLEIHSVNPAVLEDSVTLAFENPTATADRVYTDAEGLVWYRVALKTGTPITGDGFFIAITATELTSFVIDNAYASDLPIQYEARDAWCSSTKWVNRNDIIDIVAGEIERRSFIDTWGIHGDATALVKYENVIDPVNPITDLTGRNKVIVGSVYDKIYLSGEQPIWDELSAAGVVPGANTIVSTVADATRSGGTYIRLAGAGGTGSGQILLFFSDMAAKLLTASTRRLFILIRGNNDIRVSASSEQIFTESKTYTTANTGWLLADIGTLIGKGVFPVDETGGNFILTINIENIPDGGNIDIDGLLYQFADNEFLISEFDTGTLFVEPVYFNINGSRRDTSWNGRIVNKDIGTMYELQPGYIVNRILFAISSRGGADLHGLNVFTTTTLTIIPRTRHML